MEKGLELERIDTDWGGNLHNGANVVPARNLIEKEKQSCRRHMAVKEWEGSVFHISHLESVFRIQKKNIDPVVVVICSKLGQDLQRVAGEVPARALPKQAVRHGKRIVDNDNLSNNLSVVIYAHFGRELPPCRGSRANGEEHSWWQHHVALGSEDSIYRPLHLGPALPALGREQQRDARCFPGQGRTPAASDCRPAAAPRISGAAAEPQRPQRRISAP